MQSAKIKTLKTASQKDAVLSSIDWKIFNPAPVAGVDEVGRGCLAGPVFAGAVILRSEELVSELTDSKLLSEERRDYLAPLIHQAHWVGLGHASVEEIEQINILQASFLAMKRAMENLQLVSGLLVGHLLVDGNKKLPGVLIRQTPIIKGDLRCTPISAASIVAKVARDQLMRELGNEYPIYGFAKHKGYASPQHRKAIQEAGPIIHHRKTFAGVKEYL